MKFNRARLIRFLREEFDGKWEQVPIDWCAQAADAAKQTILELAKEDAYKDPCRYCEQGGITHKHKWNDLRNQLGEKAS